MDAPEDYGSAMLTMDLANVARGLSDLARDFRTELRSWTHPAARAAMQQQADEVDLWAQQAALASAQPDDAERQHLLLVAREQYAAARITLRKWWQRGEMWNAHRLRPVPATLADTAGLEESA